ncbi:MAG: hypothetical protein ACXWLR_09845 [Myxococcales bacterium]
MKAGGRTSTGLSVMKIAPLVLVAVAALRFAPQARLAFDPRDAAKAAFLSIFSCAGLRLSADTGPRSLCRRSPSARRSRS